MKKLPLVLVALLIGAVSFSQIYPNFEIENKYEYSNVSFLFNNQSAHELFAKPNAGNRFEDLKYNITLDFENDKVSWTSSDFQGVHTKIHDIVSTERKGDLIIIKCTMYHQGHDQMINEVIELNMKDKTCLYYYTQTKEYVDPGLAQTGTNAVITAAEYFEFK